MSSHVIYLTCSTEGCTTTEPIYTGDVTAEKFPDSGPNSFEGSFISTPCNIHAETSTPRSAPMPDAPTPLDLDAIRADLDASDRDLKKWVRLPVKHVRAVLAEIDRLRADVARLEEDLSDRTMALAEMTHPDRPAPARDEEVVTEAVARALWAHGSGEAAYHVADLARMWDEGTLPQDPETQHSVRVIRAQAAAALAVVRDHLPVKPDRIERGDLLGGGEALSESIEGQEHVAMRLAFERGES